MTYRPEGFGDVTPYLIVKDAEALLRFLVEAFGAREKDVYREGDGIVHAEVHIGDAIVEFGQAGDTWPAFPASLHYYVSDVDAVHKSALASGAKEIQPPRDQHYGERSSAVLDPAGNQWFIATFTGKVKSEE